MEMKYDLLTPPYSSERVGTTPVLVVELLTSTSCFCVETQPRGACFFALLYSFRSYGVQ